MDDPRQATTGSYWRLFLAAFSILLLELILIRWIPAYLRSFGFFTNFALLGSLLGVGIGALTHRAARFAAPNFALVLLLLVGIVLNRRFELNFTSNEILFYGSEASLAGRDNFWIVPVVFIGLLVVFIPLGQALGRQFSLLPALKAYSVDILGSLAGIASFVLLSQLSLPPVFWFALFALASWPLVFGAGRANAVVSLAALGLTMLLVSLPTTEERRENFVTAQWSPYYHITVSRAGVPQPADKSSYMLSVNNIGHQAVGPLETKEPFYFQPFRRLTDNKFRRVLIIGAGSGTDVAVALANGAEHVDAVEIDRDLAALGRRLNPLRPYDDPRVHVHINDGRAFLRHTDNRYDLIIFALTDSLTLTSAQANVRLESFLFTSEAMQDAKARLADNGLLVLYNYYREDWSLRKLASMIQSAFGDPPYAVTYGSWGRAGIFMAGPRLASLRPGLDHPYREDPRPDARGLGPDLPEVGAGRISGDAAPGDAALQPASDDWPFFYLRLPGLPRIYLLGVVGVMALAVVSVFAMVPGATLRRFDWHFFFLGAAFMLLETRSLVTFALLFGTTWLVNALVFFAILASVLAAILVNMSFRLSGVRWLYALLFALLALNYVLPADFLLAVTDANLRYAVASVLAFAPIIVANIVFSHAFRDSTEADSAFAANLIGLMAGGLVEYTALQLGYRWLLLPVMFFYAVAFLLRHRTAPA